MARWHHWLDGHESEWTLGVGDGQGGLACCDSWGRKESDTTERLDWTELNWTNYLSENTILIKTNKEHHWESWSVNSIQFVYQDSSFLGNTLPIRFCLERLQPGSPKAIWTNKIQMSVQILPATKTLPLCNSQSICCLFPSGTFSTFHHSDL